MPNNGTNHQRCLTCPRFEKVEWSVLDNDALSEFWQSMRPKEYAAGETVFSQHDLSEGIYCVEEGRILLRQFDIYGAEIGFRIILDGGTLGWRSYFAEEPHASNGLALTKCKICLIPATAVKRLVSKNQDLALTFLKTLARDPGPHDAIMLRSPHVPVRIRLVQLLLILMENSEANETIDTHVLDLPIKRVQIASMIGTRSETLSRVIKELGEQDLVRFEGRHVTIPSVARLSEAAKNGMDSEKN